MSALVLTSAPATEPFDVTELKSHLRVSISDDDTLIGLINKAAVSMAEEFTQRRFVTQTWEYYLDCFPADPEIILPYPPLQSVTSVEYKDPDTGNYLTWASSSYVVDNKSKPGRIAWAPTTTQWPVVQQYSINAVKITFVCGYGAATSVPEHICQAVKLICGHMYENREDVIVGTIATQLPMASRYLLMPFKVFNFV